MLAIGPEASTVQQASDLGGGGASRAAGRPSPGGQATGGAMNGPWARYVHQPDERGIGTVRYPRLVPRDAEAAAKLAQRTLTNLYNQRPPWLEMARQTLDAAVFTAYGWPADLSDEQVLERLLRLNLERASST